ncbi:hypothetical protein IPA_00510 [Ignicoccus pacificus DSM 13166]|uniref:AAA+ ATPase domain-containing protein n=1 Tax=Ignicoccus pacificus DSM 13166 TaxID=940294 RepID=A0A977KAC4_9CREN|nr:hypothetical protein IPA_00510 [Ignicoccus pacificus DSM 13166]
MICRETCAKVLEEVDLTGLISYLQYLSEKSKCSISVNLDVNKGLIKIRVCCARSKKITKIVEERIMAIRNLEKSRCIRFRKNVVDMKLFLIRDRHICIGKEFETGAPYCIPLKALERHAVIMGSTGSGKSTTTKKILKEIGKNLLVLDWHGEYDDLEFEVVDCISFRNLREIGRGELVDSLASSLGLSDSQYYLLMKVVQSLWVKNRDFGLRDIIFHIKALDESSRWVRESKYALLKRLEMLLHEEGCQTEIEEVIKKSKGGIIVDLSTNSEYGKRFISNAILAHAFTKARAKKLRKLFIVLEEAHNVAPKTTELSLAEKIYMEGRKYGLHLIAVTQSPRKLSDGILRNSALKVVHALEDVEDAKYIANSIGYPDLWKEFLYLDVGHAYFYFKKPIHVVIESNNIERTPPTPPENVLDKESFRSLELEERSRGTSEVH